jgi:hypothetical protein
MLLRVSFNFASDKQPVNTIISTALFVRRQCQDNVPVGPIPVSFHADHIRRGNGNVRASSAQTDWEYTSIITVRQLKYWYNILMTFTLVCTYDTGSLVEIAHGATFLIL